MTEAEWLSSTDPAAMLAWLGASRDAGVTGIGGGKPYAFRWTGRKLRLWVEACRAVAGQPGRDKVWGNYDLEQPNGLQAALARWCDWSPSILKSNPLPARAALIRDIAGNPFRPVGLKWCPKCQGMKKTATLQEYGTCTTCHGVGKIAPWLTPTVLSLAQAAHDERPVGVCRECKGRGKVYCGMGVDAEDDPDCLTCSGTGRIDDGALDPQRLAVLADALEETGCDSEDLLRHLRGCERCRDCGGTGEAGRHVSGGLRLGGGWRCKLCGATGWRPLPGPHVRGCFALDAILGLE